MGRGLTPCCATVTTSLSKVAYSDVTKFSIAENEIRSDGSGIRMFSKRRQIGAGEGLSIIMSNICSGSEVIPEQSGQRAESFNPSVMG